MLMTIEGCRTRAARLAAAARALQDSSGPSAAAPPFTLAFMTDRRRVACPELVARALPRGTTIIYRDYDDPRRAAVGARLGSIARARGLFFLVGGDPDLAHRLGADGVHLRTVDLCRPDPVAFGHRLVISAACHSATDLARAAAIGATIAVLSPVFATSSHPCAVPLGPEGFRRLAAAAALPVLALGGVNETNARQLSGRNVRGIAAIGAFAGGRG